MSPGHWTPNPAQLKDIAWRRECRQAGLDLTNHAIERMTEMGVRPAQLVEIVKDGSSFPLRSDLSGRVGQCYVHPSYDWCVVVSTDDLGAVITVLFRTMERYQRDGRAYRPAQASGGAGVDGAL